MTHNLWLKSGRFYMTWNKAKIESNEIHLETQFVRKSSLKFQILVYANLTNFQLSRSSYLIASSCIYENICTKFNYFI